MTSQQRSGASRPHLTGREATPGGHPAGGGSAVGDAVEDAIEYFGGDQATDSPASDSDIPAPG